MQTPEDKHLLLPIQDVYKVSDKRVNVGRVEAGVIEKGARIKVLPSGHVTSVNSIEKFLEDTDKAVAGECIGITTLDSVFLERGNVICLPGAEPVLTDTFDATIFWMSKKPFDKQKRIIIRCSTQQTTCKVETISKRIDSASLEVLAQDADTLKNLEVGQVRIKTKNPIVIKSFNDVRELGRFVLVRDENICAGGIITTGE
jgi:sulfate adenylyltransferase subunit 1 (EFTu-like GTPase family)